MNSDSDTSGDTSPSGPNSSDRKKDAKKKYELIIRLLGTDRLGHTATGQGVVAVTCDGYVKNLFTNSREYKQELIARHLTIFNAVPGATLIKEAVDTVTALANTRGKQIETYTRIARTPNAIYWHINPREVVTITRYGFSVELLSDQHPRLIWRAGMLEMPRPIAGGSFRRDLFPFLNLTQASKLRYVAGMLAAFSDGASPINLISGPAGAGKTTQMAFARMSVDDHAVRLSGPPSDPEELSLWAAHSALIAIDNENSAASWLANALCRNASGTGSRKRARYSDEEENQTSSRCSVWITGLTDFSGRADFLSRANLMKPKICFDQFDSRRRDDVEMYKAFEAARPVIMGAIADAVVSGLMYRDSIVTPNLPRMGNFFRWTCACLTQSSTRHRFEIAYRNSLSLGVEIVLQNPIAGTIRDLVDKESKWQGNSIELLRELTERVAGNIPYKWPKNAAALGKQLKKLQTDLAAVGIHMKQDRKRRWNIERVTNQTK